MLTPNHSELAFTLAKYYFDETVASTLKTLFKYDQASIKFLRSILPTIKFNQLKKSLLILVKYQLVDFISSYKSGVEQIEYSVAPQRVFSFFRFPKYINNIRQKEGDLVKAFVLVVIAERALVGKEQLINLAIGRIKSTSKVKFEEDQLQSKVSDNVESLICQGYLVFNKDVCIKFERFDRDYRDEIITNTICDYYNNDSKIKNLCQVILALTRENTANEAALTAPISLMDLVPRLVPHCFESREKLELYLTKLTMESNMRFFVICGKHDNKGAMYGLRVGLVIDYLIKEHLSSMVTTRFGPKCCRVFRVLIHRGPLLLKQIEEIIMLPARDVREYCYMLIKEGFIRNRQVPKTLDNAPGKSVFIMSIELEQVVYSATDLCCQAINNLLRRYRFELDRNKSLLDRSRAVQDLLGSNENDAGSLEEWNQYFNSHELSELHRINRNLDKILLAKTQVDDTLFLFHCWLDMKPNLESSEIS